MCHGVTLHDGEDEGGLLELQRSCVGRQLGFGDPLDVQATGGGFLGAPVVHGFNLREGGWRIIKGGYAKTVLCNVPLKMSVRTGL